MKEPRIEIEYCTQCNWFASSNLDVTGVVNDLPCKKSRTLSNSGEGRDTPKLEERRMVFSRKMRDVFLKMKELKQIIRDKIAPENLWT